MSSTQSDPSGTRDATKLKMDEALPLDTPEEFDFPFQPYPIQKDLMKALFEVIETRKVGIFESPTGTGKSLSILCSALTWLYSDRKRATEVATADLLKKLEVELPDEPRWVLDHEVERKKREMLQAEEDLENRLTEIRRQENSSRLRSQSTVMLGPRNKKPKIAGFADMSDEEFAPEETKANYACEIGSDGLPRHVKDLLDMYNQPKPQPQEIAVEPTCKKVYFTSRTHSQLSQFVGEIRKTSFSDGVRVLPLGSRSNLCINPDVRMKAKSLEAINEACMELQKAGKGKTCPYLPAAEEQDRMNRFRDYALAEIHDIEDLAALGRAQKCCPYYGARKAIKRAQVVTLPYNLLLQTSTRNALDISLDDNIVVIDEAHNLIDNILATHSVTLSTICLKRTRHAFVTYIERFVKRLKGSNLVHLKHLVRIFDCLVKYLSSWSANISSTTLKHEQILRVDDLLSQSGVLDQLNVLELENYLQQSKIVNRVAGYSAKTEVARTMAATDTGYLSQSSFITAFYGIQSFISALSNNNQDGRVVLTFERKSLSESPLVNIKYQLLNPAASFSEIQEHSRSVIFAGGTMAPMSDFYLQLFPTVDRERVVYFSCSHIVPPENLLVRTIGKGPMGRTLELKFSSKENVELLDDLGQSMVNVSNVVKHGIVCFVPSYSMLDILSLRWKSTGLWTRLEKKKKIFLEPQKSDSVEKTLNEYATAIESPSHSRTGALLLAVVGGKLSEGINFSNDLCRTVVVIGIPYPNAHSLELKERMKYIESLNSGRKEAGAEFYANLAFKAVNQSIGRAIRHAKDWSAILLLDIRYGSPTSVSRLPAWIRNSMVVGEGFGTVMRDLAKFSQQMNKKVDS